MLQRTKASYKLNQTIKDDTFNVDHIFKYNLSLQVSDSLFRICITDIESNRCLFLEDYQFSFQHTNQLLDQLELIYDDHHLLQAGFWKSIKLGIKNKNFSLIPGPLFDKDYLRAYLNINSTANEKDVYYHKQSSTDTVNIFSADKEIITWFESKYPTKGLKIFHYTSPFIEGVMIENLNREEKSMFITIEKNHLTILVKGDNKLEFCNTFNYTTAEDFVYFVMFIFDQLKLNPETTNVVLWGEVAPDSAIYHKLYKYVRNISFGNKPSSLSFGYKFDEVFDHKFYDLYNMHFCE